MLDIDSVAIVVVDVQGKLATLMHDHEQLFKCLEQVVRAANILNIPVLPVEQIPQKLGHTIPAVKEHLSVRDVIAKTTFSALRNKEFSDALSALNRKHVMLCGIECHICVYQTAKDLIDEQYEVSLITDAVGSRNPESKALAISNMKDQGVLLTNVEMMLFELMGHAEHPKFREIQQIIK